MKTAGLLFAILLSVNLLGCREESGPSDTIITVNEYIEQLRSGEYSADTLPAFTFSDIPELLKYRNETQIIHSFPHNPISSYLAPDCRLGIYVLWTIESIRAVSVNSKYLVGRFPSLNPILANRVSGEYSSSGSNETHQVAAKAYFDWWESHKGANYDEFKHIDPLQSTEFRWH